MKSNLGLSKFMFENFRVSVISKHQRGNMIQIIKNRVLSLPARARRNVEFQGQDSNKFLSLAGILYVFGNSQKDKGRLLKKHILKDLVPLCLAARIKEIQEELRQAIQEEITYTSHSSWADRSPRWDASRRLVESCLAKTLREDILQTKIKTML